MKQHRLRFWLLALLTLAVLEIALHKPVVGWVRQHYGAARAAHPLSPLEREYLDGWRHFDSTPAPMTSLPFSVACGMSGDVESITIENTSSAFLRNLWFYREDMPNFYSASTIVETVTADKKTETEKVLALWALFPRYYYNYYPLRYTGLLLDPPTLFAVFGSAQCSEATPVLETLCQLAGCETRIVGLDYQNGETRIAHCAMEVKADNRWIYLDPDGHTIYRRADGELAGVYDLARNADPVRHSTHAYYYTPVLAEAFERGRITLFEHTRNKFVLAQQQTDPARYTPFHHTLRYDLLPGARVSLFPARKGRFFSMELPVSCNGLLEWSCRPEQFVGDRCRGLAAENLTLQAHADGIRLQPVQTDRPASLVVPLSSPYLMVGGRVAGQIESSEPVRLYALPFVKAGQSEPESWRYIASVKGECSVTFDDMFQLAPVFGYALRIDVPASGAILRRLDSSTWLQCAPKALPWLAPGENRFILYAQDPAAPLPQVPSGDNTEAISFQNGLKLTFRLTRPRNADSARGLGAAPDARN